MCFPSGRNPLRAKAAHSREDPLPLSAEKAFLFFYFRFARSFLQSPKPLASEPAPALLQCPFPFLPGALALSRNLQFGSKPLPPSCSCGGGLTGAPSLESFGFSTVLQSLYFLTCERTRVFGFSFTPPAISIDVFRSFHYRGVPPTRFLNRLVEMSSSPSNSP